MDEHKWMSNGAECVADRVGIKRGAGGYIVGGTVANLEILRLAKRVEELEKLAYLGEHLFPDLTWKERAAELLADIQVLRRADAARECEIGPCQACGETREIFEGRCHDCISAHRHGGEG